ncbi:hypothetical protein EYV94_10025 [Puteibacter caeruleilacunae]|nr:hypothetical protein EYV94_10025 [Puteibacter caeruleilacunae]
MNIRILLNISLVVSFVVAVFTSCEDMNDLHDKYLQGERQYVGRADSMLISPGKDKLQITWWLNDDPQVVSTTIRWNQKGDSIVVPVSQGDFEKSVLIENLSEGSYVFELINRNKDGLGSIPVEQSSRVYGETYVGGLLIRGIKKVVVNPVEAVLKWGNASSEEIDTKVIYTNKAGEEVELTILPEDEETHINDYVLNGEFSVRSGYKPTEDAMEVIYSNEEVYSFPGEIELDKANFVDMDLPFDLSGQCWDGDISKLWDGIIANNNYYHSGCGGDNDGEIHHFTVDLGVEVELSKFMMAPRQGCCQSRNPKEFQLWGIADITGAETTVAPEASDWEDNSVEKGWIKLMDYTNGKTTDPSWKGSKESLTLDVEDQSKVRYIRFRLVDTWDEESIATALSEISFFASKIY